MNVVMPIAGESELILPEFFASMNEKKLKSGKTKITYKLVNPMSKSRNLASRKGQVIVKLTRRPVEHMVLDETNKEIPLMLFPPKDREMIKNHFKVVEYNKRIPFPDDVPLSKPFKNKERGRPTKLQKNIEWHKGHKEPSKRGRKPKYSTEEEKVKAKREQTLASNKRRYHEKKGKVGGDLLEKIDEIKTLLKQHIHNQGGALADKAIEHRKRKEREVTAKQILDLLRSLPKKKKRGGSVCSSDTSSSSSDEEDGYGAIPLAVGGGVTSSITNLGKKAYNSAKNAVKKTTEVAKKVITGNTGIPPKVESILKKYGQQIISKMVIARTPLGNALVNAMNVASMGDFKKKLDETPYDKLFHLKLILTLQNGVKLAFEKEERVALNLNPPTKKGQEEVDVPLEKTITLQQLYDNAKARMGDKFYPYSAKDNNCQDFVTNVLKASDLAGDREYDFVKQDTTSLFADDNFLRKLSNTITDLGARFNVLMSGGGITDNPNKVFPPMYKPVDFLSLPPYIQNDALAGDISIPVDSDDTEKNTGKGIDFDEIEWGSFKKYFQNRPSRLKHLKSLEALAEYIHNHPDEFNAKTRHRASFYLNVLKK